MPKESINLLSQTKSLLRKFKLHARKGLGQHFLVDSVALEASLTAAELSPDDLILEVGPGLGVLTGKLAEKAKEVWAVEVDEGLAVALSHHFAGLPNIRIVQADILQYDFETALAGSKYKVVANLPYYIAAPVIRRFLEAAHKPRFLVVMVQKEIAENMVAAPGRLNLFGVSVQLYGQPYIVHHVPAGSFHPSPKVDSAIVRIDVYREPIVSQDPTDFFRVVKAGFSTPRKQLRNSLAIGLGLEPDAAARLLVQAGISPKRRAATLTLQEWSALCDAHRTAASGGTHSGIL